MHLLEAAVGIIVIVSLHGRKESDVTGLGLMRGVREKTTRDYVIFEAKFQIFGSLMGREVVETLN